MHTIFQCAERWGLIDRNPIKLVRVRGGTKRLKTPEGAGSRSVSFVVAASPGAIPDNGADCRVSGTARQRDRCASVARFRFPRTHAADSTERGSREGRGREDRVFAGLRSARRSVARCPDAPQGAVCPNARKGGCSPIRPQADRFIRRRFKRTTFVPLASKQRSTAIAAGILFGTTIDRGWMKQERLSPYKRS